MITFTKKIRIELNDEQKKIVHRIFEISTFLWNEFINVNNDAYNNGKSFIHAKQFDKYIRDLRDTPGYSWLYDIPKTPRTYVPRRCEEAYQRFFDCYKYAKKDDRFSSRPKFKTKKSKNPVTSYVFDGNQDRVRQGTMLSIRIIDENHINLPHLGHVKIYESNYLTEYDLPRIHDSVLKYEDSKYFACLTIMYPDDFFYKKYVYFNKTSLGIDVGITNYLTIYESATQSIIKIPNINLSKRIINIEEHIKRLQKQISNKLNYHKLEYGLDNTYKDKCWSGKIEKLMNKVKKLYTKIKNIRDDYMKKVVNKIVTIIKPLYISIEDLHITQLLQKGHGKLAKHLADSGLGKFLKYLSIKSYWFGIDIHIANRYYASSKSCCKCGYKKKDLALSDRIFKCEFCGNTIDRDVNAAINLCKLTKYTLFNPSKNKYRKLFII